MLHHFHGAGHAKGQGAISADEFAAMLDHVGVGRILPAKEWMERALAGRLGDDDLCITFDDALACQYEVAVPVLRRLGLTAFWFVYSSVFEGNIELLEIYRHFRTTAFGSVEDFYAEFFAAVEAAHATEYDELRRRVDFSTHLAEFPFYTYEDRVFRYLRDEMLGPARYHAVMAAMMRARDFDPASAAGQLWMTDDHLLGLDGAGHVIGLHSYSHPTQLRALPPEDQRDEYRRNARHLERVLGRAPRCMSHPCNSYGAETLGILRDMGIALGFRANMAPVSGRSELEHPREDHANLMKEMAA
ncbi:MAG: polysaccharide deacetylase family protein [Actinomycetota bacterium]